MRRMLSGGRGQEMAEQIISLMSKTATNAEFFGRLKGWIAFVAVLIVAAIAAGGWYFHAHGYTLRRWAQRYLSFLPVFQTADTPEGVFSEPETEGIVFETLPGVN